MNNLAEIPLSDIFDISETHKYKLHAAKKFTNQTEPLNDYIKGWDNWVGWNRYKGKKNRFTREYVFSMMNFYPEKDVFLFGGIFKVNGIVNDEYDIELCDQYKEYIGRLKIKNVLLNGRTNVVYLENCFAEMQVSEILTEPINSLIFPGYENIDFDYGIIKNIIEKDIADWKGALANIKGVYMLTDKKNGKRYIGSAYNGVGIWARWTSYINNGHGGNVELKKVIDVNGLIYFKDNFKFTLLEIFPMFKDDSFVITRERYWKEVLLTKETKFGYNKN